MPANLTPEFVKARERFRKAETTEAKLAALEEMLRTIPKHKGTDHMQADIKRRMSKLRDESSRSKKAQRPGYDHIPKEGAGQICLVGMPNSGKSSLLAALSNAKPEVADYPFSTIVPVPGMVRFEDVPIQLIDLPPVTTDYTEPWVYSLIRGCDLALVVLDATRGASAEEDFDEISRLLEERHIQLVTDSLQKGDEQVREIRCRIVVSKADVAADPLAILESDLPFPCLRTAIPTQEGLDSLPAMIFDALRIIRIYTKLPGKKPDMTEPYTLPVGSTALDGVRTVHREFAERMKYVRIWGSGRFDGQQVPSDHVLEDGDVIEIHVH